MTSRRHLTLIAAAATILAAAPISAIFSSFTWLFEAIIAVGLVTGAAIGARAMRLQLWAQVLAMLAGLVVALTLFFSQGTAILGLIPTPSTFEQFQALLTKAGADVQVAYVPAPDIDSLLFITVLGIGGVAVLVDLFAVGLRKPALAGLPMLAIYSVPVAIYTDSVSPLPFIVGSIGFLWLLVTDNVDKVRRFGRRFTGEGRGVDLWEPSPLAAAGRRLAIFGVLVAVVLPIAVPGMTAGFFAQFGSGGSGPGDRFGQGNSVNLFAMLYGELNQTQVREMVRVTTNDPNPFYLRFGTAEDIQLDGFRNRTPLGRPVGPDLARPPGLNAPGVVTHQYKATVEVFKNFNMPMAPVYYAPTATRGLNSTWNYDSDQYVVYSLRSSAAGARYEFDFVRPEYTADSLRTARPLPQNSQVQRSLTALPAQLPEVTNLVTDLTKGKTTVYDKVLAIYEFFSQKNNFQYDLTVPEGSSGQKITDFLQVRRGFCQQYAAAMAWMVRAADIPARVAFGFTKGSSYTGGVYPLTNRNLHAWTEVYFDGFGWVPFDATPSAGVTGSARDLTAPWAPNVDAPQVTPSNGAPISPGPTSSGDTGPDGQFQEGNDCPECGDGGTVPTPKTPAWVWWLTGAGAVLLTLLALPAMRRRTLRRRRAATASIAATVQTRQAEGTMAVVDLDGESARRQAHAAWDELLDTMVDYRITIDVAETPRSTAERLIDGERLATSIADSARRLGHAEERARYSLLPAAPQGLMPAVTQVRKTLSGQAGRWVKISAILMPPSVVQRWRARVSTFAMRFSTMTTSFSLEMRRLTRPLRPRRAR